MSDGQGGMQTYRAAINVDPRAGADPSLRLPSILWCGFLVLVYKVALKTRGYAWTARWIQRRAEHVSIGALADDTPVRLSERRVALACALYPGRALCLERSWVLYYLLRQQGVDVRLVNGVKVDPFGAHAWLEYQGEPLNDVAEHVALYTRVPEPSR